MIYPLKSLSFSIASVLLVLLPAMLHLPKISWMPAALIVAYIILAYRDGKTNPSTLSWSAEQTYFLGYLCTITAFVGLLLRIWFKADAFKEVQSIVMTSWIALSTIIVGLIGMTFLRSMAQKLEQTTSSGHDRVSVAFSELIKTLEKSGAAQFASQLQALQVASTQTDGIIQKLNDNLLLLNKNVQTLNGLVSDGHPRTILFVENVKQTQAVLDDFVRLVERNLGLNGEWGKK